jgi:hypothetical protein
MPSKSILQACSNTSARSISVIFEHDAGGHAVK